MSYLDELFGIKNKVAVVTGGTGVLGTTMCHALAKAGAKVVIIGRRKDAAEELAASIRKSGQSAIGISADVLDEKQLLDAKEKILNEFKSIG